MERQQKIVLSVVFSLLLAGGMAVAASGRERSLAIYPAQYIPLHFDHALHLEEGADCLTCHDSARKSQSVADLNFPAHPECETCHDIEAAQKGEATDPPSGCRACHVGFDKTVHKAPAKVVMPTANLKFPHKVHVDRKIECAACHGSMTDVGLATRMQLPKMETCLRCHDGSGAASECGTCHLQDASRRLQLNFASGVLRPQQGDPFGMDHGPRFEFTHATRASNNRGMCMECHTEASCQTCHDSLQKPLSVHPNDYITLHPVEARMDSPRCESCHRFQSFCVSCHERVGVAPDGDLSLRALNVKVHPNHAEFVASPSNVQVAAQHHGIAASRDIRQCAACHREDSCLKCHASPVRGSLGVNPHPVGFGTQCASLFARNPRPCIKCHGEAFTCPM